MKANAWTETENFAVSKLIARWGRSLKAPHGKGLGLGLMAVSLAACGDSDSNDTGGGSGGGGGGGGGTTTDVVVNGTDLDGDAYDGATDAGPTTIELKGNTDPNVDAGEWISYETLLIRDANGDFTITDIQATENDAADGTAGTDVVLMDMGQNTAGTTTLTYDTQAVDGADTVVNLSLDEVAGIVALTGGNIETVNITVEDGANEASILTDLQITGVTTLSIAGGVAGQEFTIAEALDTTITTLDGASATGNLILDVTGGGSASYALGSGDDQLEMGNGYDDGDSVSGGAGADVVAMEFTTATIREGTMSGVETLNTVFGAAATFDGSNVTGLSTINLGIDGFDDPGNEMASTADADFNDMGADFTTLNIHATQIDVEVDYQSGVAATLAINFHNDSGAITVGDDVANTAFHLIGATDVTLAHGSNRAVRIDGQVDLSDDTEILTLTTSTQSGDLFLSSLNSIAAFVNSSAVTDFIVDAVHGDMNLNFNSTGEVIENATALQLYQITADDADLRIGEVGDVGASFANAAIELEIIDITMTDDASLEQGEIFAFNDVTNQGANIALFSVTASDKNILAGNSNVIFRGVYAEQVDHQILNAADDGNIILTEQQYTVGSQVFLGSGDIVIEGSSNVTFTNGQGYVQTMAADATGHSGTRIFIDHGFDDIFYGSTGDDNFEFNRGGNDTYFDAGGNDRLEISNNITIFDDGSASQSDIGTATDDTYLIISGLVSFNAGGGQDTVTANGGFVTIDFADRDDGMVHIVDFTTGPDTLSFDGMGDITAVSGIAAPAALGNMNVNAIYVFADGDAVSAGSATIADYTNMTDVADYLDQDFTQNQTAGDEAVFVINNGATTANTGDTQDAYVYSYLETGGAVGIQADDLTLIATADGSTILATDIV